MQIVLYALSAVLFVLLGAVVSGGWPPPGASPQKEPCTPPTPPDDDLARDLAALLAYAPHGSRREDEENEI